MQRQEMQLTGGGTLTLWEDGELVHLQVCRPDDRRGLYKVWVHGRQGRLLLGTLVPEGGALRLYRRLTRNQLERDCCWPVTGGETVLAFSFGQDSWVREEHPERLVKDVVLRQALKGTAMLLRRVEGGFRLSASFDTAHPFPITPLFCLSKVEGGRVIFSFDREGNPVVPHNDSRGGENSGIS
ncbi:MAG: hypothetical protein IKB79_06900 [Oscillospiraceae bacterium]|nr:hypothetical protein [Oscillospiraceae bacterium]